MGNGIKMRSANDKAGNVFDIDTLQSNHDSGVANPPLFCPDPSCGSSVRFVSRHQKNKELVEPTNVAAFIGLTSGSAHVIGCRFDADKRLTAIADSSDPDFLTPLLNGARELRLLLLHNGLSNAPISGANPSAVQPGAGSASVTTTYTPSGNHLDSYLRTTADLLELRELCDSDATLAAKLTLRFGAKSIPWSDFFYEKGRFSLAWAAVKKSGSGLHPIAILGEVGSVVVPKAGANYSTTYLNCRAAYRATGKPNELEAFEVTVQYDDPTWLAGFKPGTHVLMFGLWEYQAKTKKVGKPSSPGAAPVKYIMHKLMLRPKFKQQLRSAF